MSEKRIQPIRVFARQRPFNQTEIEEQCPRLSLKQTKHRNIVVKSGSNEKGYNFDYYFDETSTQAQVYSKVVVPEIKHAISGYNCTVFAYGSKGTGKTHSIFGEVNENGAINTTDNTAMGLIPRTAQQLFVDLSKLSYTTEYTVKVSFIEIYKEEVLDLLHENTPLRVYDDPLNKGSVLMKDLTKRTVISAKTVEEFLKVGLAQCQTNTATGRTQRSRSHILFTFFVDVKETTSKWEQTVKSGRLQLIDLADSDNNKVFGNTESRIRKSDSINCSIQNLVKVIRSLIMKVPSVPFRESKLTRILQDSLGGNTRTSIIATFSPSDRESEETIQTLDLIQSAKSISCTPQINVNKVQVNLFDQLQTEIKQLKEELCAARNAQGVFISHESYQKITEDMSLDNEKIGDLVRQINELEAESRDLESQYLKASKLLEQSKTDIDNVQEEMQETQKEHKNLNTELFTLCQFEKTAHDTAKVLLNVSENARQKEDIYYQKFQARCALTQTNAQLCQNLTATARNFFEGIENKVQEHHASLAANVEATREFCMNFISKLNTDVEKIDEISEKIQTFQTEYQTFTKENLTSTSTEIQKIATDISQVGHRKEACAEVVDKILKKLRTLEVKIASVPSALQTLNQVKKLVTQQQNIIKNRRRELFNVDSSVTSRRSQLDQKTAGDKEKIKAVNEMLDVLKEEEQKLTQEGEVTDSNLQKITSNLESSELKESTRKVQDIVHSCVAVVNTALKTETPLLIDGILQETALNQEIVSKEIGTERVKTNQGMKEISALLQHTLQSRNIELLGAVSKFNQELEEQKIISEDNLRHLIEECENKLNHGVSIEESKQAITASKVEETAKNLRELSEKVSTVGHVGDTPARTKKISP